MKREELLDCLRLASLSYIEKQYSHVMQYTILYTESVDAVICQSAFEPSLVQYNVDLVMFGHVHIYERNKGIGINGTVDPNGYNNPKYPVYLTNGAGGHYDGLDAIVPNNNSWSTFRIESNRIEYM
jgi:hypothetical protein